MPTTPTPLGQDPRYEPFLQAPVGEDRRGISVTVLSMLAQLGIDPWGEASDLAALPDGAAQKRLEDLIARFNPVPTLVADRGRIVSRLLAFLPRQAPSGLGASDGVLASAAFPQLGRRIYWIIGATLCVGWLVILAQGH